MADRTKNGIEKNDKEWGKRGLGAEWTRREKQEPKKQEGRRVVGTYDPDP